MKLRILLLAPMLLLAACGSNDDGTLDTTAATQTTPAPETTVATIEAPSAGTAIEAASSGFGDVLVDGDGNALYLFVPDAQGASVCYDECAGNWPPLVGEVAAGDGVDGSLLGSVARDDGSDQVTYNGWPLYYFAADAAPGDANGQGVNDVWFVLSPAGEIIR